jgi:hypothetical protein
MVPRPFILGLATALALAPVRTASAQAKDDAGAGARADAKKNAVEVDCVLTGNRFPMTVRGAADLPDGTLLMIRCDRTEQKKVVPGGWQMTAPVRGGRFQQVYYLSRDLFQPGTYVAEVTVAPQQPEAVAKALTDAQKALKLTASVALGGVESRMEAVLDIAKTSATALRAASAASLDFAKQVASASEEKLADAAWKSWKAKSGIEPAAAAMAKALERPDATYYFPTAAAMGAAAARLRTALAACDAAAAGQTDPAAKAALASASLPSEDEATRLLWPVYRDGLQHCLAEADAILVFYTQPPAPPVLAEGRKKVESFLKDWAAFKAVPWKAAFPARTQPMEDACMDLKALAAMKPPPPSSPGQSPPAGETPADVARRIRQTLVSFRAQLQALPAEIRPGEAAPALAAGAPAASARAAAEPGEDKPRAQTVIDLTRPLVSTLRAAAAASMDFDKQVLAAGEGKLAASAWTGWKRKTKVGPGMEDLDGVLARGDLALYLPSVKSVTPVAAMVRTSLAACDAAVEGKEAPEAVKGALGSARLPNDDEVTRALRPVYLDAMDQFVKAAEEEVLTQFVSPPNPKRLAQGKKAAALYVKCFTEFKDLPWKGSYPIQFQLMDDVLKEVKALPQARIPAPGEKEPPKGAGETADAVATRIKNYLNTFRNALAAEKLKKL